MPEPIDITRLLRELKQCSIWGEKASCCGCSKLKTDNCEDLQKEAYVVIQQQQDRIEELVKAVAEPNLQHEMEVNDLEKRIEELTGLLIETQDLLKCDNFKSVNHADGFMARVKKVLEG